MPWTPGPGPTDGDDTYHGDFNTDTVSGGVGNDVLYGFGSHDFMDGGTGDDTLIGEAGDDFLSTGGGVGNDTISAGIDNDVITINGSSTGMMTIDGGDHYDIVIAEFHATTLLAGTSFANVEAFVLRTTVTLSSAMLASIPTLMSANGTFQLAAAGVFDLSWMSIPANFNYRWNFNGGYQSYSDVRLTISGTSGDDTVIMPAGAEARIVLYGGEGNDNLTGGAGADTFIGWTGNDTMLGGDGNDRFDLYGGGVDSADGGAGDDRFEIMADYGFANLTHNGSSFSGAVNGGDGNDTLVIGRSTVLAGTTFTSIETIQFNPLLPGVTIAPGAFPTTGVLHVMDSYLTHSAGGVTDLSAMTIPGGANRFLTFTGSAGNDTFIWGATAGAQLFANGGLGDDTLRGGAANDVLSGGGGANILDGGGGDDRLIGGPTTTFIGGDGYDTVDFSTAGAARIDLQNPGNMGGLASGSSFTGVERFVGHNTQGDFMYGDDADNRFEGGGGNDTLHGLGGNDILMGGGGTDELRGGTGNDILLGGYRLYGEDGDDTLTGGFFADGGAGSDTLDWSSVFKVVVDLNAGTATPDQSGTQSLTSIENAIGSGTLRGSAVANMLTGLAGDDILEGLRGADTLNGAGGSDTAIYTYATQGVIVDLSAGMGWDGFETDTLISIENVEGAAFDDHFIGNDADNTFVGYAGADTMIGNGGSDTLLYRDSASGVTIDLFNQTASGGSAEGDIIQSIENVIGSRHNDVFVASSSANYFDGFLGINTVSYANSAFGINADRSNDPVVWDGTSWDELWSIENIVGSAFDDVILWDYDVNVLWGGDGNDVLQAGRGGDTLDGGDGDDTAAYGHAPIFGAVVASLRDSSQNSGYAAGDVYISIENLRGSGLADTLIGDGGANALSGVDGNDNLQGYEGNDTLDGGAGADTMIGGAGNDEYYVDNAGDVVTEAALDGDDTVRASVTWTLGANLENLILIGSGVIDGTGNALDNLLAGNAAANTLNGGDGNDFLEGGGGADRLFGGAGDDLIFYDAADDLANVQGGDGADALVFVNGGAPTSFNLGAHGFETAQGWFVVTGAVYTHVYDGEWRLSHEEGRADNGASWYIDWDETESAPYQRLNQDFDASGQLTHEYGLSDNGSTWNLYFDTDGTHPYVSILQVHTAGGIYANEHGINDNGSTWDTFYDVDGTNPFQWIQQVRDVFGVLAQEEGLADSGTSWFTDFDETGTTDYVFYQNVYDTLDRLSFQNGEYDTGYTWTIDYDETETQAWTSIRNDYDDNGVLIGTTTIWDGP